MEKFFTMHDVLIIKDCLKNELEYLETKKKKYIDCSDNFMVDFSNREISYIKSIIKKIEDNI